MAAKTGKEGKLALSPLFDAKAELKAKFLDLYRDEDDLFPSGSISQHLLKLVVHYQTLYGRFVFALLFIAHFHIIHTLSFSNPHAQKILDSYLT